MTENISVTLATDRFIGQLIYLCQRCQCQLSSILRQILLALKLLFCLFTPDVGRRIVEINIQTHQSVRVKGTDSIYLKDSVAAGGQREVRLSV